MNKTKVLIFLFFISFSFSDSLEAFGGKITPANLSFIQTTPHWQIFYGTAANTTIKNFLSSSENFSIFISLPSNTSLYYLISDSATLEGNYSIPNYEELNSHFELLGNSRFEYVFDNFSNFSIYVGQKLENFTLPTLFLAGLNENNTQNNFSFRVGVIKKGEAYAFVVPIARAKALDGNYYDYIFALPTKAEGRNYYVFTFLPPLDTQQQTQRLLKSLSISWIFDGEKLSIFSEPFANILIYDELGSLRTGVSDQNGVYIFNARPGSKYYIKIRKDGFREAEAVLYIPVPQIIKNISQEKEEAPVIKPEQTLEQEKLEISGQQNIYIESSGGKISICFEKDCYLTDFSSEEELQKLAELNCVGQFCSLVGISKAEFINKYQFRAVQSKISQPKSESNFVLDYVSFFQNLGFELSKSLGSTKIFSNPNPYFFLYFFVFISTIALLLYVVLNKFFSYLPKKGHD
ncbi:MAG: hypothetical protein N3D10_01910 [Candidatus Micrarchaeota archaeon]|nr:hypothetical protein [Candidatus Micrarchaeota archaeon]